MSESASFAFIGPGDPAPWFRQRTGSNPAYTFDTAAGRYLVLAFAMTFSDEMGATFREAIAAERRLFDDDTIALFGVTADPADVAAGRAADALPGLRCFIDADLSVSRLYGAVPREAAPGGPVTARRFCMVLDPTLRVMARFDLPDHAGLIRFLKTLKPPAEFAGFPLQAPVLILPNVFEPTFCKHLIGLYETQGGEESGFMREVDGKTVGVLDRSHKVRKDVVIEDDALIKETQARISRRVVPEILKVHQFKVTRMERYIVSCYAAEDGGHFRPHRDNTTSGTAHRRFAVSINLNDDFDGGEVSFPEYGRRGFKMPAGGACVFSCSLLHTVSVVTRGRRYAFLPFLYDDAAAKIREANISKLEGGGDYKA